MLFGEYQVSSLTLILEDQCQLVYNERLVGQLTQLDFAPRHVSKQLLPRFSCQLRRRIDLWVFKEL